MEKLDEVKYLLQSWQVDNSMGMERRLSGRKEARKGGGGGGGGEEEASVYVEMEGDSWVRHGAEVRGRSGRGRRAPGVRRLSKPF